MRFLVIPIIASILLFFAAPRSSFAIYDPLSVPNNKVGVHILQPDELERASKLVNNDGKASWGYVTVPIQSTDRNRSKWLHFMTKCSELHVIPIIRIATFAEGPNWAEPNNNDLTDFANFLNDLPWPTENRYIIIFNEVNRTDEYGGSISPEHYTDILSNAITIFKSRSDKYFILPAGLDNAAANSSTSVKWSTYLERMYRHNPDIFNRLDGWSSHAYPNPEFEAYPRESGPNKIDSFRYDIRQIRRYTKKNLPIFITETGWSNQFIARERLSEFYRQAFRGPWSDTNIVAITPFLLHAGAPPFERFSLIDKNDRPTLSHLTLQSLATTGAPLITPSPASILPATLDKPLTLPPDRPTKIPEFPTLNFDFLTNIMGFLSGFFIAPPFDTVLTVRNKTYFIETVSSDTDLALGLSKYDSLPSNRGMLFKFKDVANHRFWMKDMKFDIDIIWLRDNKVIGIRQGNHLEPTKQLEINAESDSVLEVNINSDIKIDDIVNIK